MATHLTVLFHDDDLFTKLKTISSNPDSDFESVARVTADFFSSESSGSTVNEQFELGNGSVFHRKSGP